jgi:hypothetical protein
VNLAKIHDSYTTTRDTIGAGTKKTEAHDNCPRGIQLSYTPNIRKADYRAALAFFDRAIFFA